ncbi:MAG: CHC2 zinc finger domain-containing protein [Terrisporobacter sp.]|uniref:CHC2 zinc finger domain-containing protein n=1 Tax=Terrisporobacter sp. TaxID=1965305 RepID=UPI002FC8421A
MIFIEDKNAFKKAIEDIGSLNCLKAVMENYGIVFEHDSSGYKTNCVFHSEKTPSLRLSDKGNKAFYNCFGCGSNGDIINFICKMDNCDNITALKKAYDIIGLTLPSGATNKNHKLESFLSFIKEKNNSIEIKNHTYNLEDIYIYYDKYENPLYLKTKYRNHDNNKKHFITKALLETENGYKYGTSENFDDCEKTLYNMPQVKKSLDRDEWIFFVEGEKDAKNLSKLNLTATTIYSKKWQDNYTYTLQNAKIAFIGDTGRAGQEFQNFVTEKLKKCAKGIKIVNLPGLDKLGNNKDVSDWLETGKTKEDLLKIVRKSLDILNKFELQQDEKGIYQIQSKIENDQVSEYRKDLTNFRIIEAILYRNVDSKEQSIKFTIVSQLGTKDTIEVDGRECFSDVRTFRKALGFDYTFKGNIHDLIRLQEWILNYFISEDICIYTKTGIRHINGENVLITNNGMLKPNGEFLTETKANNYIHDIDFTNLEILSKEEATMLAANLFHYNVKENVYNTLGLGVANILNSYARNSTLDNLPILQDLGESKSGKSKALTILRLLFNNTKSAMSLSASTDFALLKAFDDTYLPIFLDEVKMSKVSKHKVNALSNHIRAITEGYENAKGTKNQQLIKYTYNASLIISGEEEMQETAVKNRSNIVWYAISNFTPKGKEAVDFLCSTKEGETYLRRFSKSLYLYVLNHFIEDTFEIEYLITKNRYNFETKLQLSNSREVNTATYTMLGLSILIETFRSLGVDTDRIMDLNEAANIIVENLRYNVLDENESGSKSEYEKILEDINHLACIEDRTIRVDENVHYKILSNNEYIAFDFKTIYDKLNKYYKLYKNDGERLLDYKTFTKMISKSGYVVDSDPKKHYKAVKRKVLIEDDKGLPNYVMKNKKMFILKIEELRKLEMDNIFEESPEFEEIIDNVIPFN